MQLTIRTHRVQAQLTNAPFEGTALHPTLLGRARLRKPTGWDGPALGEELPPSHDAMRRLGRISLLARIWLIDDSAWEGLVQKVQPFDVREPPDEEVAYREAVVREARSASVLIWYWEHSDEDVRRYSLPRDAYLDVKLRVQSVDRSTVNQWLLASASTPELLPHLWVGSFFFTPDDGKRVAGGVPTWGDFLDGKLPTCARDFVLRFRGRLKDSHTQGPGRHPN